MLCDARSKWAVERVQPHPSGMTTGTYVFVQDDVEYDSMHYPFFFLISGSRRYGVWVEISQKFVLLRRSRSSAYHFTRSPGDVLRGLSAFGAVCVILIPLSIFSFRFTT